ncbi:hypothetical protein HG536_0B03370 [Torulaspora globosa]|uniref:Uncharacterized protein n=1 Tax=Torulaspora globosa TaxID=48254 RepID=A0A7G3ZD88_9SACH|nr:uncharacterized protein HG536_0B03370 [Torulaspora globosa]QLL31474.1 hypothetical protein HG536_0B03370 [Torulaspora globosa]
MTSLINEPSTDFHLKLNEQLFHIPYELLRRNVRQVHKLIEKESLVLQGLFKELDGLLKSDDLEQDKIALVKLNEIIRKVEIFEKKINRRSDEELKLLERIHVRLKFFEELEESKASGNVSRLTEWYQKYTNVLIGDYLIRNDQVRSSAEQENSGGDDGSIDDKLWNPGVIFLKQQQLDRLLDYDILLAANRISKSLTQDHDMQPLLHWIGENRTFLKKNCSFLEFEARLQEYVELLKQRDYQGAIGCFQKFLLQFAESNYADLKLASGLLVFINSCQPQQPVRPIDELIDPQIITTNEEDSSAAFRSTSQSSRDEVYEYFFRRKIPNNERRVPVPSVSKLIFKQRNGNRDLARYTDLLDSRRWYTLNELFTKEYYLMYGISHSEPLLMYLSLGISTLKTRECLHEREVPTSDKPELDNYLAKDVLATTCPVCTDEFASIAKDLPYAHHTQSKLFENPVMLPNGNIYDAKKLKSLASALNNAKLANLKDFEVMDPIDKKIYSEKEFITMYPT